MTPRVLHFLLPFVLTTVPLAAQAPPAAAFQRDIVYGEADGAGLKLDYARPVEGAGPFPLVICIHGGAWQSGDKSGYAMAMSVLAQHGYASAAIDYRLAPRYKFPAQLQDARQAVRYLRENAAGLKLDPSRIAVLGDSAGGHLALLLGLTDAESGIRTVVNLYGPTDLPHWQATAEGEAVLGMTSSRLLENVFGTSDRSSAVLRAASPIHNIGKAKPAVLTLHGDSDQLVNSEQATWLHEALRKAGLPEKLVILKGASHGFQGAHLETAIREMVGFLGDHLVPPQGLTVPGSTASQEPGEPNIPYSRIDAHVHVGPPPEPFLKMLEKRNVRLVDVTLIDPHAPGYNKTEPQTSIVSKLTAESRGRIGWASTFDPAGLEDAGFAEKSICAPPIDLRPGSRGRQGLQVDRPGSQEQVRPVRDAGRRGVRARSRDDRLAKPHAAGAPGGAEEFLATSQSRRSALRLLQEQPGLAHVPAPGASFVRVDHRRSRPHARRASQPSGDRVPSGQHGARRGRDRQAVGQAIRISRWTRRHEWST